MIPGNRKGELRRSKALLADMNASYAVVNISGKTRVMSMEESPAYPGCMVPVYSIDRRLLRVPRCIPK